MNNQKKNNKGFTLIEIMIAMCIGMILMAGVYFIFISQSTIQKDQTIAVNMMQNLRAGFYHMERDIRLAGLDPKRTANAGITTADFSRIVFTIDENMDGNINAANGEQVQYALTPDAGSDGIADDIDNSNLVRTVAGVSQIIATNVQALKFYYLDENDILLNPAGSVGDPTQIRTVQLAMITRATSPKSGYSDTTSYQLTLPNNNTVTVYTSPGDRYTREMLTTSIRCRNLK